MTDEIRLLPCPFCTCKAVELEIVQDGNRNFLCAHVECPACLARGPQEATIQNAIDFWNECEVVGAAVSTPKQGE